ARVSGRRGDTRRGGADYERLNDAMLPNRIDEFLQCFVPEIFARLQRAGNDVCQIDLVHSLPGLHRVWARRDRGSTNQCAKPLAETRPCHAAEATGTLRLTQTAIRDRARDFGGRSSATLNQLA